MSSSPSRPDALRIGIVGAGQIARVQHFPAIAATPDLTLVAVANPVPVALPEGVSLHASLADMLAAVPELDAIAICTPSQVRYGLAVMALDAGKHVLLEKPPAATPAEVASLALRAAERRLTLFTAWHSLFNDGVDRAREILATRGARGMRIVWKEDVRKHHPGADWFWQPGGMGAFDAGINALSIVTSVMPEPVFMRAATLMIPEGAHTPMAASLRLATPRHETGFDGELDWSHADGDVWSIGWTLEDGGILQLERGGALLKLDGDSIVSGTDEEYPRLYIRFRDLIRTGRSEVEMRPLQLVADAFMLARHLPVARHPAGP
jgi:predicted dehydrogenase